jgi:2-C-methyl-D-erythritol 4-phosphate cytidylyltransferase/2-C-methyl-D-erythritol 2,4-cyclodiphosphate synthase
MNVAAILVAGGAGLRAGGDTPKQWREVAGRPLLRWAAEGLLLRRRPLDRGGSAGRRGAGGRGARRPGGGGGHGRRRHPTRSVAAGLAALSTNPPEAVLVHDAARPFVTAEHVRSVLAALEGAEGALPALPVGDTLKRAEAAQVVGTVDRDNLHRAQTPQAFRYAALARAYASGAEATDDAALVEQAGGRVVLTPGDPRLFKLTYPEDFAMAEALAGSARITVVGQGYDVHAFGPGDRVWLCGVEIAHDRALVGHSDADAGLHALTDALLGAIGAGDIGDHFPPSTRSGRARPPTASCSTPSA